MDAVGQLTGGIAHDFNNMLAVIISSLSMFKRRAARGEVSLDRYIDSALEGAAKGAALTQRLLAFSRQQALRPEPTDPNRLVTDVSILLRRTLGELIHVETVLAAGIWKIKVDKHQLESALINLGVNSRDAMPKGGKLTLETTNSFLDERYARAHQLPEGQYVLIAITDTGVGMSPEVLMRACDPFFTTKPTGAGTGLGLSQVHGFARQSGGHLKLYSEVGQGTTVKIYLPRYFGTDEEERQDSLETVIEGRKDLTILVVEDEAAVRALSVDALKDLGYHVIEAQNPREALNMIKAGAAIDLLFTDVVMPDMNGRELADLALQAKPGLRVLFTTGYTRNAIVHNGMLDADVRLLSKPFTIQQLSAEVRAIMEDRD